MIKPSITGKIAENLYCLGPEQMPTYLLDGESPALFDAGMSIFGEHYLAEIRKVIGTRPLAYLFISHVHFDHCGSAGHLKQAFPELTICASPISSEILAKESARQLIGKLNTVPGMSREQEFIPFTIDREMTDGEQVVLGEDSTVQVFATPGHTRDMTSYYLPEIKTLLPSEAAGVPDGGGCIFPEFLADYDAYFSSLHRLAELPCHRILCAHRYFYDGEDVADYFPAAIRQTTEFRAWVETLLDRHGTDYETIFQVIKEKQYGEASEPKMAEAAYDLNLAAKIRAVAKLQEQKAAAVQT